ncbi:MAG: alpha/beta hydrolase, partial [Actinomycetaceae bacterium]|nr:alpha/beta hydrolase [Actinomycetaceae bacterium]
MIPQGDTGLSSDLSRMRVPGGNGNDIFISFHGITDCGASNADLAVHLRSDYTVVLPDARGHGLSPRFSKEQLKAPFETMVEDACQLIVEEVEQSGKPVIIHGHSMGGAVAVAATQRCPDYVRALVLEEPALLSITQRGFLHMLVTRLAGRVSTNQQDIVAALEELRQEQSKWSNLEIAGWSLGQMLVEQPFLKHPVFHEKMSRKKILARLHTPTLIVTGDTKPCIIGARGFEGIKKIGNPQLETVLISSASHCVRRDNPQDFYRALDAFLEK